MTAYELVARISLDSSAYESGLSRASGKTRKFGALVKSGLAKTAKLGAAAVVGVGVAATTAGIAITRATGKVAEYGDNIDKMSQKMGLSSDAYQEWDAVMRHSGTSMESMKAGMKTLANAAEKGNEAFQRIGLTQEEISKMSQQELFEATIKGLQNVDNSTERTYLAGQLLGRGATELGALLNHSAEETQEMRDKVHELGGVMSEEAVKASAQYQDSLQDMQTAMQGLTRNTLSAFLPSMVKVMDGLSAIFSGGKGGKKLITEGIDGIIDTIGSTSGKFTSTIGTVFSGLLSAINENLPQITSAVVGFLSGLAGDAIKSLPDMASAVGTIFSNIVTTIQDTMSGIDIVGTLSDILTSIYDMLGSGLTSLTSVGAELLGQIGEGMATGIPSLMENILPALLGLSETLRENAGVMIDAGLDFILNLAQGIADSLPVLIAYLPQIISNIANIINDNAPKVLATGVKIIMTLGQGIVNAWPAIVANFGNILRMLFDVFMAINWVNLGTNLITFIKNGITTLQTAIPNALKNIGETAMEWLSTIQWATLGADIIDLIVIGVQSLGAALPGVLKTIATTAVAAFKAIPWASIGKAVISLLATAMRTAGGAIVSAAKGAFQRVVLAIYNAMKTAQFNVNKTILKIKLALGFSGLAGKVKQVFENIKQGISDKIQEAKDKVQSVINAIKKLFPFNVGKIFSGWIPKIKLTTNKSGDSAKTNSSVGKQNFARAMAQPYMFRRPTEFYAGEAGDEVLYGRKALMNDIATVVGDSQQESSFGRSVSITNYITVEGAENPEDFAERFIRKLKLDMRTA